ncbi:MAG: DUF692 family protein [Pirellulaceae bacterium]
MIPAIGYALREQNRPIFDDPAIDAVEVTFERADDPLRVERYIGGLDVRYASIHALKLSPGSPDPPSEQYLARLKDIALENDARSISDHLGFTRDGAHGTELGHFAPVPPTRAALDATSRNVDAIVEYFAPLEFYIETIAYLFRLRGEMSEAEFLRKLLTRTGCGLLLDVTNVYANSRNFGFDARQFIDEVLPAAASVQMHLAGGFFDDQAAMYIDSHSHPVPAEVWDLYRHSLRRAREKVSAVFIERDQNFPDEAGWRDEIQTARKIAEQVASEEETVLEPR